MAIMEPSGRVLHRITGQLTRRQSRGCMVRAPNFRAVTMSMKIAEGGVVRHIFRAARISSQGRIFSGMFAVKRV